MKVAFPKISLFHLASFFYIQRVRVSKKPKYHEKTVSFGGQALKLYSLDGVTWSSKKEELHHIHERHEKQRLALQGLKPEEDESKEESLEALKEDESDDEEAEEEAPRVKVKKDKKQATKKPVTKKIEKKPAKKSKKR